MTYAPSALDGDHEWDEEYVITSVRDVYDDPKHDRVVAFFSVHGGLRTVAIARLRIAGGSEALPRTLTDAEELAYAATSRRDHSAEHEAAAAPEGDQAPTKPARNVRRAKAGRRTRKG